MSFVNLHVHTALGSMLDGFNMPSEIVDRAADLNHPAVAITDHGQAHGLIKFYKRAKEKGIKPILGCEFYITKDMYIKENNNRNHLIVLAKNNVGLKNLYKLISLANKEGFYYKPRLDYTTIQSYSEGLIVLSACIAGSIPQALLDDRFEDAVEEVYKYKETFGDNFYLEIQSNKLDEQYDLNEKLVSLSKKTSTSLVAASDVHYLYKEDSDVHDAMLAIQTKSKIDDSNRFKFPNKEFYFKDREEIARDLFRDRNKYKNEIKESLDNTLKISEKCDINIEFGGFKLPDFDTGDQDIDDYLIERTTNELFKLYLEKDIDIDTYAKRLKTELDVIIEMGYPGYFLIVADFLKWSRDNGNIIGPGRGSAAGCLISYLLGITSLDPIEYDLLFERFLSLERKSLPDIDLDFADDGREEVLDYVIKKYGTKNVASICTFGTLSCKAVIKDVGRSMGYDFHLMNEKISKAIPSTPGITIEEALEESADLRMYKNKYPKLFEYALKMEGKPRHLGEHACAVVIAPEPIENFSPLAHSKGDLVTQFEMDDCESLGLLKMDFLGLKTLDIIDYTIEQISKRTDADKIENKYGFIEDRNNVWNLPLDDYKVYNNIYSKADTNGVFQMESRLFKGLLEKMEPNNIEHIIALLALGRPGPLDAGIDNDYIDCLHGKKVPKYPHKDIKHILEPTFGLILYQEQIMQIAQVIAGFSLGEADILRRGMGKKKAEVIESQKVKFINGALDNGYQKELAEELFELIEYFSGYGFNRSHSACYAFISYATAFLKEHFPAEFYASMMTFEAGKSPKDSSLNEYIADCYMRDINILPPDINQSFRGFRAVEKGIRYGISSIKGVGDRAVENIMKNRPYDSFEHFVSVVDKRVVNKTVFESLIKSGAFDAFNKDRNYLLEYYKKEKYNTSNNMSLFNDEEVIQSKETTEEDIISYEIEIIGMSITNPSEWDLCKDQKKITISGYLTETKEITTKNNNRMAFSKLKTKYNDIELVIFPSVYRKNHHIITNNSVVKLDGKKDGNKLLVDKIEEVDASENLDLAI